MAEAATAASTCSLLDALRDLTPLIERHAPEAEEGRQLSTPVVEGLRDAGFFRMFTPKSLGGLEVDLPGAFTIFRAVAEIDSAVGWCLPNNSFPGMFGAWLSDPGAAEIFGDPSTILAGTLFPPAKAIPVEGGYRVSGRMPFVSLCHHANWYLAPAQIHDGDEIRTGEDGQPVPLVVMYPRRVAEIVDNWDTLGMRGTGSHDVMATDAFVPSSHTAVLKPLEHPGSAYRGPLYRCPLVVGAPVVAVAALGGATQAWRSAVELATTKTPAYMPNSLRDRAMSQAQLAEAKAQIDAAQAYIVATIQEVWDRAVAGEPPSDDIKMQVQLAATFGTKASAEAIDLIHAVVGTSGIRQGKPFARHYRDVHTLTQHAFASAGRYESVGRMMMGHDTDWPFLTL